MELVRHPAQHGPVEKSKSDLKGRGRTDALPAKAASVGVRFEHRAHIESGSCQRRGQRNENVSAPPTDAPANTVRTFSVMQPI
jgi:hypothetical protein